MVQVVKLGPLENAFNALQDGTSMPLDYAEPSPTNADHGIQLEIVIHVIQVMCVYTMCVHVSFGLCA